MPDKVNVKIIFPTFLFGRARFESHHRHTMSCEWFNQGKHRACFIRRGEDERGFIRWAGTAHLFAQNHETRAIVCIVLYADRNFL